MIIQLQQILYFYMKMQFCFDYNVFKYKWVHSNFNICTQLPDPGFNGTPIMCEHIALTNSNGYFEFSQDCNFLRL